MRYTIAFVLFIFYNFTSILKVMKTVLIAGGTGYIGKNLEQLLADRGYTVKILTRNPSKENHILWNPDEQTIDASECKDVQVLVNLCGEGLDKKRWTKKQRKILIDSRVEAAKTLYGLRSAFPSLEHYISASGITAYGFDEGINEHSETDNYGRDFLSRLVEEWERSADLFKETAVVSKLRIAVVFEWEKGTLKKMSAPIKFGFGSPLGSGKQQISWVHISDLVRIIEFVIATRSEGTYNTNAGNISNEELTKAIARTMNKRLWMPNVPAFLLKLLLGKMSEMILYGAKASNQKLKQKGFSFSVRSVEDVVDGHLRR